MIDLHVASTISTAAHLMHVHIILCIKWSTLTMLQDFKCAIYWDELSEICGNISKVLKIQEAAIFRKISIYTVLMLKDEGIYESVVIVDPTKITNFRYLENLESDEYCQDV